MGARLIKRSPGIAKAKATLKRSKMVPHICGRAKVIARNGSKWTIRCGTGCSRTQVIDIQSPRGKEWLIATGRAKKLDGTKGKD